MLCNLEFLEISWRGEHGKSKAEGKCLENCRMGIF